MVESGLPQIHVVDEVICLYFNYVFFQFLFYHCSVKVVSTAGLRAVGSERVGALKTQALVPFS